MFLEALFQVKKNAVGTAAAVPRNPDEFALRTLD